MRRQGLSLVEILIAAAILLAAMVPLWGLMGSSHQQVMRSADEIKASQLAIEILEQLENNFHLGELPSEDSPKEYNLNSGGVVTISDTSPSTVKIGTFDSYFMPKLFIETTSIKSFAEGRGDQEIGRMVTVIIKYKSKEGRDLDYILRGFVSAKK